MRIDDAVLLKIREIHQRCGDDNCWMAIDEIFKVAGLPAPDRAVGDKQAMLKNCERFVNTMCDRGPWQSYAELEAERDRLQAHVTALITDNSANIRRCLDLQMANDWLQEVVKELQESLLAAYRLPEEPETKEVNVNTEITLNEVEIEKACREYVQQKTGFVVTNKGRLAVKRGHNDQRGEQSSPDTATFTCEVGAAK